MIYVYFTQVECAKKIAHIQNIRMLNVELFEVSNYSEMLDLLESNVVTHLNFYLVGFPRKSIENSSKNTKYLRKLFLSN